MLKGILIFAGGFAAGAGTCYFLLKKKIEADSKVELKAMQDFYIKRAEKKSVENQKEVQNSAPVDEKKEYEAKTVSYSNSFSAVEIAPEESKSEDTEEEIEEEDAPEEEELDDYPREVRDEPYSITPSMYDDTCDYYDKVELSYYDVDGVVVEEDEEIIAPFDLLGHSFTNLFGEYEEDTVYIRNDKVASDYKIERIHAAWYDKFYK